MLTLHVKTGRKDTANQKADFTVWGDWQAVGFVFEVMRRDAKVRKISTVLSLEVVNDKGEQLAKWEKPAKKE